jgi:hypothetical protein
LKHCSKLHLTLFPHFNYFSLYKKASLICCFQLELGCNGCSKKNLPVSAGLNYFFIQLLRPPTSGAENCPSMFESGALSQVFSRSSGRRSTQENQLCATSKMLLRVCVCKHRNWPSEFRSNLALRGLGDEINPARAQKKSWPRHLRESSSSRSAAGWIVGDRPQSPAQISIHYIRQCAAGSISQFDATRRAEPPHVETKSLAFKKPRRTAKKKRRGNFT